TWGTSATATTFSNYITTTSTAATLTYYAGKQYTCSAGYYRAASATGACSVCTAGNWCPGVTNALYSTSAQGLSSCSGNLGTGYTSAGGTGDTANTKCYLPVSAGYIRSGTSGTTTTACAAGKYKTAHNAYYGSSYSCSNVNAGYWNNGGGTNATGGVISGKSGGTIAAGRWGAAGATSDQGSGAVSAGYYSTGGGTSATPTAAGNGCLSSKACGKVTAGCYTTSTGSTTACPNECPGDMTSDAGSDAKTDCKITCTAGTYLAANTGVCATCRKGNYCANNGTYNFNASSNQGIAACSGTNQWQASTGKTSCDTVTDGMYKSNNYTLQNCGTGYYCKSGVRTGCVANSTTTSATASNVSACLCNPGYSGNAASTSGTCTPCAKGTYKGSAANTTCSNAGSGYYVDTTGATTRKNCSALDSTKTDGTYSSVSPYDASTTCRFKQNAPTVPTYCATKTSNTMSYTGSAWPATTYSVTAKAGSIISGNNTTSATCSQCSGAVFSAGGSATSCTSCPAQTSGWTRASGSGWDNYDDCYQTKAATAVSNYCSSGQLKQIGASATTWATATVSSTFQADSGAYVTGTGASTTCSQCTANYYCTGGTATRQACSGLTGVSVDGGTYTSAAGSDASTDCKYTAPSKTITGCSSVTTNQVTYSGTAWPATTYTVSADAGYYIANNNSAIATCTACTSGYYCTGGTATRQACSSLTAPAVANGTFSSVSPYNAATTCRYVAPATTATGCSTVTANTVSWGGSAWGSGYYTVTASKGYRVSATNTASPACAICGAGTYQSTDGSTATSCTNAADGKYVAGTGASTDVACAIGSYSEKTSASTKCIACPTGRTTSGTGTKYNATANTACSATCSNADGVHTWATPSWSANTVSNLCTASKCNANTYYTATTGTNYKNTCTACGSYSTTSAGNTSTTCACDTGYTDDGTVGGDTTTTSAACKLISDIACLTGQYLPAKATSCSTCTAGNYCPSSAKTYSYSTSTQGLTPCAAGTYQPDTGKTSCVDASAGYYVSGTGKTAQTICTGATYQPNTGQSSCLTCPTAENLPSGVTVKSYGYWIPGGIPTERSGCSAYFDSIDLDDGTMGASYCYIDEDADSYGMTGTSINGCFVRRENLTCDGGYYNKTFAESSTANQMNSGKTLATAKETACTDVESGYWSGADELTRTACATGLVTCGAGKCANEAADCGRILHAGNQSIYLRSVARTSPALNVKIGNQTFFGALSTSYSSALKVKNDGTTYSVVNDYE
ncbi:MAG: hypothetical protein IKB05_00175, partial [Alphaproteobacteria bacterium]|nr:hypothetical protein [Alphaproteobacteria bacterium]